MPSQRRTLPENQPDTEHPNHVRYRACTTCKHTVPAGSLLNGQCPDCAGLQPLPLRGERGRFLPGLTPTPGNSTGSTRSATAGGAR